MFYGLNSFRDLVVKGSDSHVWCGMWKFKYLVGNADTDGNMVLDCEASFVLC